MSENLLLQSFFIGGFESSCHRLRSGKRLDLIAATGHDRYILADYTRLKEQGILTAREAIRWHLIEPSPGRYNFSSVLPMIRAAREQGIQVIWDLCHFGWPDDIDIFKPAFIRRFAGLARAFAQLLINETDDTPFMAPITEISFLGWAGGDVGYLNPFALSRGFELKAQLVRAVIEGIEAVWSVDRRARFLHTDPLIHVTADPARLQDYGPAEGHRQNQFQAWDMLAGRLWPQLGGAEQYLDIVGLNYYIDNQWFLGGRKMDFRDPLYRPLSSMVAEVYERYGRPMIISETSIEGETRPDWLRYICREVTITRRAGIPFHGVCWYPILDYPGWDDERYCPTGLWGYPDEAGRRDIYPPLADEWQRQQEAISPLKSPNEVKRRNGVEHPPIKVLYLPQHDLSLNGQARIRQNGKRVELMPALSDEPDLICLSHLRWDFVYQRPQHLLTRCGRERRVFYVEEPVFDGGPARLEVSPRGRGIYLVVPHLPGGLGEEIIHETQQRLLDDLMAEYKIRQYLLWYYTPMALPFTRHLDPVAVIYDCMDELSLFKGASPVLRERELELLERADLVFTGGYSLYEAKRTQHPYVYPFPSSIDKKHFGQARRPLADPADQAAIPHPRLGFFGVIDERLDINLVGELAQLRPDWHFILIGPVAKIDPATLPRAANLHYLGAKTYQELPVYLSGWDVALMPFALNEATRFISPTKTPEYLAGGKPVVSTPIRDVIRPYGEQGLVQIATTPADFSSAIEAALVKSGQNSDWLRRVDALLAETSWDSTWAEMSQLLEAVTTREKVA